MGHLPSKANRDTTMRPQQPPHHDHPSAPDLEDHLLQPASDASLRDSWMLLNNMIVSHVNEFYDTDGVTDSSKAGRRNEELRECGIVEGLQESQWLAMLLSSPKLRKSGLRICIARVVLESINFYGDPQETILDPTAVNMLGRFRALNPKMSPGEESGLATWRMLTALYLHPKSGNQTAHFPCVQTLDQFLQKYVRIPDQREAMLGGLKTIAQHAARFGEELFCHPSEWSFKWSPVSASPTAQSGSTGGSLPVSASSTTQSGSTGGNLPIVTFPALVRSTKQSEKLLMVKQADISYEYPPVHDSHPESRLHSGDNLSRRGTGESVVVSPSQRRECRSDVQYTNELEASSKPPSRRSTLERIQHRSLPARSAELEVQGRSRRKRISRSLSER